MPILFFSERDVGRPDRPRERRLDFQPGEGRPMVQVDLGEIAGDGFFFFMHGRDLTILYTH